MEPSGVIFSTYDEWSTDRLEIALSRGGLVLTNRMDAHESVMLSGRYIYKFVNHYMNTYLCVSFYFPKI